MDELISSKEWSILLTNWILVEGLLGDSKESVGPNNYSYTSI
jgi:hypothetical protein